MLDRAEILLDGLCFAESPRWREGVLWFSDMQDFCVRTVDLNGRSEVRLKTPEKPSGLGWLPDGRLLVVSMADRKVLRLEAGRLELHADLSTHVHAEANDMITLPNGRSYVGNFGYDIWNNAPMAATVLMRVEPDGAVFVAAHDLLFPNGMAVTPDGQTLIVAETRGQCLTAFDMAPDGALKNRRVWAPLDAKSMPDGIAMDSEGAVWTASPRGDVVYRVQEGGRITHRIKVSGFAIACALGGAEGRDLLICSTKTLDVARCRAERLSCIEHLKVDVSG